jgi:hypothetical protein
MGATCCAPTDHGDIHVHHTYIPVFAMGLGCITMNWFSPWAWDAQRHTYRATSPQIRVVAHPSASCQSICATEYHSAPSQSLAEGGVGGQASVPPRGEGVQREGLAPSLWCRSPYLSQLTKNPNLPAVRHLSQPNPKTPISNSYRYFSLPVGASLHRAPHHLPPKHSSSPSSPPTEQPPCNHSGVA